MTKIVTWNIRQGGADRIEIIREKLAQLEADVCVLTEWSGSPASLDLQRSLKNSDWPYDAAICEKEFQSCYASGILIASKSPLRVMQRQIKGVPEGRWLVVEVTTSSRFTVTGVHIPNYNDYRHGQGSRTKYDALGGTLAALRDWQHMPGLLTGDFNTGKHDLDETDDGRTFNGIETQYVNDLADAWPDAFRYKHPKQRDYSLYRTYRTKTRGFRIDHAFVHPALVGKVADCHYEQSDASDHRPLVVELDGI